MIEVENIKCSSISYGPKLNESLTGRLISAIEARKVHEKWVNKKNGEWFMKGSRYHNTERNLEVIVSNARNQIGEEHLEEYFNNLSDEHLNIWIDACLLYSGDADYYYTYEKEWD